MAFWTQIKLGSSGGGGFNVNMEVPTGTINGDGQGNGNTAFTLAFTPNPSNGIMLFLDGGAGATLQIQGNEYTLSGRNITFNQAPLTGMTLYAFYTQ